MFLERNTATCIPSGVWATLTGLEMIHLNELGSRHDVMKTKRLVLEISLLAKGNEDFPPTYVMA